MILTRPSFDRALAKLSAEQQHRIGLAVEKLERSFGRPHLHAGIGVRSVGKYFECRAGLGLRLLFVSSAGDLILVTAGSHDHIAKFIRNA